MTQPSPTDDYVLADTPPFVISRSFDAPRQLVWKALTEVERMAQWWGPKGCKVIASKMDLRPGGTYHYGLQMPDGAEMWGKFTYREIDPPSRLVFTNGFSNAEGGDTRHPMAPDWPLHLRTIMTLTEQDGRTTLTIEWHPINAEATAIAAFDQGRPSMTQGWTGTLDSLTAYLATARP